MADGKSEQAHWGDLQEHREKILDVGKDAARRGGVISHLVDWLGWGLSHPAFLLVLTVSHLGWMLWNSGWLPLPVFDPYPFTFLATIASLEAPFLSVMILMYQRRQKRIADIRQETELQIALHSERETTRVLQMVSDIHRSMKLAPRRHDQALETMKEPLHPEEVAHEIEEDVGDDGH